MFPSDSNCEAVQQNSLELLWLSLGVIFLKISDEARMIRLSALEVPSGRFNLINWTNNMVLYYKARGASPPQFLPHALSSCISYLLFSLERKPIILSRCINYLLFSLKFSSLILSRCMTYLLFYLKFSSLILVGASSTCFFIIHSTNSKKVHHLLAPFNLKFSPLTLSRFITYLPLFT